MLMLMEYWSTGFSLYLSRLKPFQPSISRTAVLLALTSEF